MNGLSGRSAVVTGASSGIGRAIALEFASAGAGVLATGRRADRLQSLCDEVASLPRAGAVASVAGDVTDPDLLDRVLASSSDADIVVLSAGVMKHAPVLNSDPADWQALFDTNVISVMTWAKAFAELFSARGRGHIVLISSILARSVQPTTTAYSASKSAINSFAQGLRSETGPLGVRVTEILPGFTESELRRDIDDTAALSRISGKAAALLPSDVADAVLYAVNAPKRVSLDEIVITPQVNAA